MLNSRNAMSLRDMLTSEICSEKLRNVHVTAKPWTRPLQCPVQCRDADTRRLRGETISHYYDSVPTQHYVLQGSFPLLVSALKNIIPALFLTSSPSTPWDGKRDRITTLLFDRARHFFGIFWLVFWSPDSLLPSFPAHLVPW